MREYAAGAGAPTLVLAHGAGAGHDHPWMRRASEGLSRRGIRVVTFDFPYRAEGRKIPDRGPVLEAAFVDAWHEAVAGSSGAVFAGGKSMGGRIASQVAARNGFVPPPTGLVFFGYPLHPPGQPTKRRDRHLPEVGTRMLFLHGTRDPFGAPEEMTALVANLPRATLEIIEGGDHSLVVPKRQDLDGQARGRALDAAASFILNVGRTL